MNVVLDQMKLDDVDAMAAFGRELAAVVQAGDIILLGGDLGAGKTTLARAIIHALAPRNGAFEVPSPTFTLVQAYDTTRIPVMHADLYRVTGRDEAAELGLEETGAAGLLLVEWPERARELFHGNVLEIELEESFAGEGRTAKLTPHGRWRELLPRVEALRTFLERSGWSGSERHFLQGDASSRRYERLRWAANGTAHPPAVLMDMPPKPDGPPVRDGLPYSRIAHLAEDVRPFVAIDKFLRAQGLSGPAIYAADIEHGFLVLEDLGDAVFAEMARAGADMAEPVAEAVEVLLKLAEVEPPHTLPIADEAWYALPHYDLRAREIEVELLLDWYWPAEIGSPAPDEARHGFLQEWRRLWPLVEAGPAGLMLRDYHSPNLMWLPQRQGIERVGIIDFQDAMIGHLAYDLVSLLQDARVDMPPDLEPRLLDHYLARRQASATAFDVEGFRAAYAVFGAQRAVKILGIFTRLSKRDNKHGYLRHMPRMRRHLERNLRHEKLTGLRQWFAQHLPGAMTDTGD
ncbi:tRNA (adenosine(37)-N6)-threonylcarbamoyltransferase complex ATPase subunit type 1 TsaE [Rhodoligotrophos defluvii]|uniref:tRNA (adenosine(37)-N6)-threonylcarbamoyltransferase complex ATPase subunit type 1 TsaE n=1 Tax=Rhodoligotrophos defluvii TaxID=2561934 RepID=UPI001EF02978|nr:tRNA (adenosine(37)-N6)-threonylcarbamoyltransferase complex ATPase subunit type 1 TsaE [Rhodoligotrophos defluvii]